MNKRMIIGLTGPIASGKDEVVRMLKARGAFVVDADRIGHEVIAKGTPGYEKVVSMFGKMILAHDHSIDRKKLGALVFGNKKEIRDLDKIVHPLIFDVVKSKLDLSSADLIVVNAAVLKEIGLQSLVDKIWVVIADREIRMKRLMKFKKLSKEDAMKRIRSQMSEAAYRKMSDVVIDNSGTVKELERQIKILLGFPY